MAGVRSIDLEADEARGWRAESQEGAQQLRDLHVKANNPHYDATFFPHIHPYGTGSLLHLRWLSESRGGNSCAVRRAPGTSVGHAWVYPSLGLAPYRSIVAQERWRCRVGSGGVLCGLSGSWTCPSRRLFSESILLRNVPGKFRAVATILPTLTGPWVQAPSSIPPLGGSDKPKSQSVPATTSNAVSRRQWSP